MTSYRLVSHFQAVGAIIRETLGLSCMMTPLDLEAGVKGQILTDSQDIISYKLTSHSEPLGLMIKETFIMRTPLFDIKDVKWWQFCVQNKAKNTLRQAFLAKYICANLMMSAVIFLFFRTY